MKTVYLILYLWHASGLGNYSIGGPSMSISAMPSLSACEEVGTTAKKMADEAASIETLSAHCAQPGDIFGQSTGRCMSKPTIYRCIEVAGK